MIRIRREAHVDEALAVTLALLVVGVREDPPQAPVSLPAPWLRPVSLRSPHRRFADAGVVAM